MKWSIKKCFKFILIAVLFFEIPVFAKDEVEDSNFSVTLLTKKSAVDIDKKYLFMNKDIIYVPLTPDLSRVLGIRCTLENDVYVISRDFNSVNGDKTIKDLYTVDMNKLKPVDNYVVVENNFINRDTSYPFYFDGRSIYMPLTWDILSKYLMLEFKLDNSNFEITTREGYSPTFFLSTQRRIYFDGGYLNFFEPLDGVRGSITIDGELTDLGELVNKRYDPENTRQLEGWLGVYKKNNESTIYHPEATVKREGDTVYIPFSYISKNKMVNEALEFSISTKKIENSRSVNIIDFK